MIINKSFAGTLVKSGEGLWLQKRLKLVVEIWSVAYQMNFWVRSYLCFQLKLLLPHQFSQRDGRICCLWFTTLISMSPPYGLWSLTTKSWSSLHWFREENPCIARWFSHSQIIFGMEIWESSASYLPSDLQCPTTWSLGATFDITKTSVRTVWVVL